MKVKEIIEKNDSKAIVFIYGTDRECYKHPVKYFRGEFGDVPEYLRDCEVFSNGLSSILGCFCISIPYLVPYLNLMENKNN